MINFYEFEMILEGKNSCSCKCLPCSKNDCSKCDCKDCKCDGCKCKENKNK